MILEGLVYSFSNSTHPYTMNPFKLISTRKVYENPWISVREDRVEKWSRIGIFWIVTMKSGTAVLIVDDESNVILSREYKYALWRENINLPGGAMDEWESPLECAKRETEEELGYIAQEWVSLWHIHPLTTLLEQTEYLFLARKITKTKKYDDIWEEIEEIRLPYEKILDMVMNSEITHAGSVVAILKAQKYLQ